MKKTKKQRKKNIMNRIGDGKEKWRYGEENR